MIKVIATARRKAGLDKAEFHRHWREQHAPLVLHMKALRAYVQCHRIDPPIAGFEDCPLDGVAELWFDDLATLQNMPNDPDYINGAQADEKNFVDTTALAFLATREECVIVGPPIKKTSPSVKAIFLLKRRADMSVADFQDYWLNQHAPQIPRDAGVTRYVQCHPLPETYQEATPVYDGVAELSFADRQAFEDYWNSPRIQAIFAADAPKFLGENCSAFLAEENRVLWT